MAPETLAGWQNEHRNAEHVALVVVGLHQSGQLRTKRVVVRRSDGFLGVESDGARDALNRAFPGTTPEPKLVNDGSGRNGVQRTRVSGWTMGSTWRIAIQA